MDVGLTTCKFCCGPAKPCHHHHWVHAGLQHGEDQGCDGGCMRMVAVTFRHE